MARTKRNAMNIAEARQKIQTTQLVKRLAGHALGEIDMVPSQVRACEVLLKKTLPDLVQQDGTTTHEAGDTLAELMKAIDGRNRRVTD